ncbi:MAG: transposase [Acidobacteria bacterium]|nr:transposase [Acidobacteriota bacterium]
MAQVWSYPDFQKNTVEFKNMVKLKKQWKLFMRWVHRTPHWVEGFSYVIVTGATYQKQHFLRGSDALQFWTNRFLETAEEYEFEIHAWIVFSNHYHFIARAGRDPNVSKWLKKLHQNTSKWLNQRDDTVGRKVWYQFWDSEIRTSGSYLARMHYVLWNAVHHGLVLHPMDYPWSSYRQWEASVSRVQFDQVSRMRSDRVAVKDDFDLTGLDP